jgi:hypothetical protein
MNQLRRSWVREASHNSRAHRMPSLHKPVLFAALLLLPYQAHAELPNFTAGQSYQEVKAELIKQGWQPVKNMKIGNSSLYAQEIYQQGMEEVVDCVSMELDGCWFKFKKGKQVLEVKTITTGLKFETIKLRK